MKKMLVWFLLSCKRNFKNPAYLLFISLLPLLMFSIHNLSSTKTEGGILVGIFSSNPDLLTQDIIESLVTLDGAISFTLYNSKEDLINHVKDGSLECGYEFPDNFKERIDKMNYKSSINLITSPSTISSPLINEIVFSSISKTYGVEIATSYIKNSSLFENQEESAVLYTREQYEFYNTRGGAFRLTYEYLEGSSNAVETEKKHSLMPIRGILAVLLFVAALFSYVIWLQEKESGTLSALPIHFYSASKHLSILATLIPLAVSSLVTLKITNTWEGFAKELASLSIYLLLILLFCGFLSIFIKNSF